MKKSTVYFSMDVEIKRRLEAEAKAQHRSMANMMEWLVLQYFEGQETKRDGPRQSGKKGRE